MRREIEEKPRRWEGVVRLELLHLLIELSRGWEAARRTDGSEHVRISGLARIMPALSLVHSLPWRKVSVPEAAGACRLSVSRFHGLFRHTMGMSFGGFALRARLSLVAHRVSSTDRPIAVIAGESSFVDAYHLDRVFVSRFGCTPGEYRRRAGREGAA